jgi:hypothetical protein
MSPKKKERGPRALTEAELAERVCTVSLPQWGVWLAPGFLQPGLRWAERSALGLLLPVLGFVAKTTFGALAAADTAVHPGSGCSRP